MNKNLILIIEDDNETRFNLEDLLRNENIPVLSARNGKQGLSILETFPVKPDLIILDIDMPIMNGFEFRKIQMLDKTNGNIPVLFISQHAHHQVVAQSLSAAFLLKPIRQNILLQSINAINA
jgi:CheY-like chemotaxis protein